MERSVNFEITGRPVSRAEWQETMARTCKGDPSEIADRMPTSWTYMGKHLSVCWDELAEPREVACVFVDALLGRPHSAQQDLDPTRKALGAYESALWKLELELGGELIRTIEPVIDKKPGEVRRVLLEAFGKEDK